MWVMEALFFPRRAWLLIAAVVVIALGGGFWFYKRSHAKGPHDGTAVGADIVRRQERIFIPQGSPSMILASRWATR